MLAIIKQIRRQVSHGTPVDYQADEQAGVVRLQLAIIKQMNRQVSTGSAGNYQADEQARVARLRWRVSGR